MIRIPAHSLFRLVHVHKFLDLHRHYCCGRPNEEYGCILIA